MWVPPARASDLWDYTNPMVDIKPDSIKYGILPLFPVHY